MSRPAALTPGIYHGLNKKPPFFEGWYYKLGSADEKHKLAIIPGVILGQDAHAFVQVLDGVEGTAAYINFPLQDFQGGGPRAFLCSAWRKPVRQPSSEGGVG